ncbi:Eif3g [Symbiodinium necroappetens]|uniref:Eif3g protein n=1 Tax=Symbiodinium necroappetens TaxID=1628268 RepID=A0A812ZRL4_9DINO|nr:Eif3g [Symbiodinium necroappetens]
MPPPGKWDKGKGKTGKSKGKGSTDGSTAANASYSDRQQTSSIESSCKFFGSSKGCNKDACPFSHSNPNGVPFCAFFQRGQCEKGAACTFRHQQWSSPDEAKAFYASRDGGLVETSAARYKQVRRGGNEDKSAGLRLGSEHVELEGEIEKDFQEETYGSNAMRMMEKMGYKAGSGLGKENQGRTSLLGSCIALEHSSGTSALGFSHYAGAIRVTAAERAARLADARAKKCQKLENASFVHHNLLSSDESSDGEDPHVKSRDTDLLKGCLHLLVYIKIKVPKLLLFRLTRVDMGLACGTSHLPQASATNVPNKDPEGDDNWKALLTATSPAARPDPSGPAELRGGTQHSAESPKPLVDGASQDTEAYGLLDEYVDDLLGIPWQDRPVSWSRPSWQETAHASGMSMPEMVMEDGSRGPALQTLPPRENLLSTATATSSGEPLQPVLATPYLAGVLNGWAEIDRSAVDAKVVRDSPAPKRRADKVPAG